MLTHAGYLPPPHHVVFGIKPLMRSITFPLSLSLSVSLLIDQTPSFLTASTKTAPAAFGPVAEKESCGAAENTRRYRAALKLGHTHFVGCGMLEAVEHAANHPAEQHRHGKPDYTPASRRRAQEHAYDLISLG